ncbi:uncharacterized protein LOC131023113 [Salvia miltiorrhiza]|uniref:uncharacterized protein LOC131023113 n=1 Tax=Salvia miltiorrhiza TaxID=226208 RepID=UPI0025AD94D9|nr:uncharacterized protein LOC131023113 [Salvia miltiorrhiza]
MAEQGKGDGEWRTVARRRANPQWTDKNSVRRTKPRNGITFFFNNFPEGIWQETLEKSFNKIGKVTDIFFPRKRDIKGKPFGFVRFEEGSDKTRILGDLNNTWFGSYKLRAYLTRFERSTPEVVSVDEKVSATVVINGCKDRPAPKRTAQNCLSKKRESGKTFREALGGTGKSTDPLADEVIGFQPTEVETEWLTHSFTGFVKTEYTWEEFGEEINSECATLLKISSLGGNLVLIQSTNNRPVKDLLTELNEWTTFWFDWVRPWSYIDVNTQRSVWTKWFGVPLQAWNSRFFEILGAKIGMVLKIHDLTKSKDRLDFAMIQISTGLAPINKTFVCKIDGAQFKIRVEEVVEQIPA